jgi:hypothetical protein
MENPIRIETYNRVINAWEPLGEYRLDQADEAKKIMERVAERFNERTLPKPPALRVVHVLAETEV